jgi:hypothetical protein
VPRPAWIVPAAAAVLVGVVIAACGSSGGSHPPPPAASGSVGVRYAECMRRNGVSSFPDPGSNGIVVPNSINPASPAFQTAQRACQSLMPGPAARGPADEQERATLLGLSRCMRAHGVSGFPDPVKSPPASPAGFAMAFGRPGAYLVIPDALNPRSPAYRRAAGACGLPGTHPRSSGA